MALRTSPFMIYEFSKLVKIGKDYLNKITCPILILRSKRDEIIPYEVGDLIYNSVSTPKSNKWITDIKDASHIVLSGNRKEATSDYIKYFLKGGLLWKRNMKKEI